MKLSFITKIKLPAVVIIVCLLISAVFITISARSYFSEYVFYVNQHKYKLGNVHGSSVNYITRKGPSIEVQTYNQDRKVFINKQEYSIHKSTSYFGNKFELVYPNGHTYKVENQLGSLISYDANGEVVIDLSLYIDDYPNINQDLEEHYFPASLVRASYPEYHSRQGNIFLFYLSFVLLFYGWSGFRYRRFQDFLFLISLRWIWVNDAQPSEFHYFMCKVGGILTMIGSVYLCIESFMFK